MVRCTECAREYSGLGNETSSGDDESFFKLRQQQFVLAPSLGVSPLPDLELSAGFRVKFATTDDDVDTLSEPGRPSFRIAV